MGNQHTQSLYEGSSSSSSSSTGEGTISDKLLRMMRESEFGKRLRAPSVSVVTPQQQHLTKTSQYGRKQAFTTTRWWRRVMTFVVEANLNRDGSSGGGGGGGGTTDVTKLRDQVQEIIREEEGYRNETRKLGEERAEMIKGERSAQKAVQQAIGEMKLWKQNEKELERCHSREAVYTNQLQAVRAGRLKKKAALLAKRMGKVAGETQERKTGKREREREKQE